MATQATRWASRSPKSCDVLCLVTGPLNIVSIHGNPMKGPDVDDVGAFLIYASGHGYGARMSIAECVELSDQLLLVGLSLQVSLFAQRQPRSFVPAIEPGPGLVDLIQIWIISQVGWRTCACKVRGIAVSVGAESLKAGWPFPPVWPGIFAVAAEEGFCQSFGGVEVPQLEAVVEHPQAADGFGAGIFRCRHGCTSLRVGMLSTSMCAAAG